MNLLPFSPFIVHPWAIWSSTAQGQTMTKKESSSSLSGPLSQSGQLIIESIIVIPIFLISFGGLFILILHLWIHVWAHHQIYENFICRRSEVPETICHQKFIQTFNATSLGAQVISLKYSANPNLLTSRLKVRPLLGPSIFIKKTMPLNYTP